MPVITDPQIQMIKNFITTHHIFVIAGHKEPDGDCISSSLVMAKILTTLQKPFQLISAGPFKRPEIKIYEKQFAHEITLPASTSVKIGLIIVDCGEIKRLGEIFPDNKLPAQITDSDILILDHHKTSVDVNEGKHTCCIVYPDAPATAYLVQDLYEKLIGKTDKDTAELLFFGLATDTGYFRFLNENSADIFRSAARLIDSGVTPRVIYDKMTSGKPYNTRKLLGLMLDHAQRYFNGRLVITYETMEDTHKYGQEGRDSDSLYQLLLTAADVEAVVFIRQETDSSCTMGFRSKDDIDVSVIAAFFGGGGHKNASGCSTPGTIETLTQQIQKQFEKIFVPKNL